MNAGARGELAASVFTAVQSFSDFAKIHIEHIVKEKRGAFERRKTLQRKKQGEREVFRELGRTSRRSEGRWRDDRFGQPGTDIGFAAHLSGFEAIQAKPDDDAGQIRPEVGDFRGLRGVVPAQISVLNDVLALIDGTEHAISHTDEVVAMRFEFSDGQWHSVWRVHAGSSLRTDNAAAKRMRRRRRRRRRPPPY